MMVRASNLKNSLLLAAALALPTQAAIADIVSTDQLATGPAVQADRKKIRDFLNRADAERHLRAMGIDAKSARDRVDALSDAEVVSLASKIDTLPAGGNLGKNDIIIILLVAVLVALIV